MTRITQEKRDCFYYKIKNLHKSKVDALKKLSTRAHMFYDLLHFSGYPFTKSQFSQKSLDRIHFFQLFWHCHTSKEAWESKLELAYFLKNYFQRMAIVPNYQLKIWNSSFLNYLFWNKSQFFPTGAMFRLEKWTWILISK